MQSWVVLVFSGFAGFFLLALLPMCIELGVEVTYPATEGVVTGKKERERGGERGRERERGTFYWLFYPCVLNWVWKLLILRQREL